jgi:hypothetical protein
MRFGISWREEADKRTKEEMKEGKKKKYSIAINEQAHKRK